jgi:putative nucleotidyltransferase with HDIG domain
LGDKARVLTSFAENHLTTDGQTVSRLSRPQPITAFAVALGVAACGLAVGLMLAGQAFGSAIGVLLLGAFSMLAEKRSIRIGSNAEVSVSVLPIVFGAVVFGPLAAMAIGAIGILADLRRPYVRWLTWTSWKAISSGLAGVAATLVLAGDSSIVRLFLAISVAVIVESCVDAVIGGVVVSIRRTGDFFSFVRQLRPVILGAVPLYAPVILLLVYAYEQLSFWGLLLFLVPAFAAHRLHGLYREQRETTEQLQVANKRLERASLSFATALVAALDARDQYTAGHSAAVAVYARDIADQLNLSEDVQHLAYLCGLVHDVGKVGLPAGLLEKPGPLTLEERRKMEEHSAIGERILGKVDDYNEIARIVRHHHERIDGNGYPDRLVGDEIPIVSRIIAVADAYNAMTSGRPYRDAMPSRVARFRLAQASGTQFDVSVVAAFEAILAGASETYLSGARPDFAVEAQRQPLVVASVA